jgi:hypothetical protein
LHQQQHVVIGGRAIHPQPAAVRAAVNQHPAIRLRHNAHTETSGEMTSLTTFPGRVSELGWHFRLLSFSAGDTDADQAATTIVGSRAAFVKRISEPRYYLAGSDRA